MHAGQKQQQQQCDQHLPMAAAGVGRSTRQQWLASITHSSVWLQSRRLSSATSGLTLQVSYCTCNALFGRSLHLATLVCCILVPFIHALLQHIYVYGLFKHLFEGFDCHVLPLFMMYSRVCTSDLIEVHFECSSALHLLTCRDSTAATC